MSIQSFIFTSWDKYWYFCHFLFTASSDIKYFSSKMSESLDKVADVDIDPSGTFKYILITVTDSSNKSSKQIVRGNAACGYHCEQTIITIISKSFFTSTLHIAIDIKRIILLKRFLSRDKSKQMYKMDRFIFCITFHLTANPYRYITTLNTYCKVSVFSILCKIIESLE